MAEISSLLATARSVEDVVDILGEPEQTHSWDEGFARSGATIQWRRLLQYTSQWTSLDLHVFDQPDGTVSYGYTGKLLDR